MMSLGLLELLLITLLLAVPLLLLILLIVFWQRRTQASQTEQARLTALEQRVQELEAKQR